MRIVFLGTPRPAVPSLAALHREGHEVVLVVTRPDRRGRRGAALVPAPIKQTATALDIEVFQPTRVRDVAFRERLTACAPDVLVVVAYGRILPRPVLEIAPLGAVNLHFSLLPSYRGAAPVQWAIARGERSTGVTTMRINERMDEGDILLQEEVEIGPREHTPVLQDRLAVIGAELLVATLDGLHEGSLAARPQPDTGVSLAPLVRAEDGHPDPGVGAAEIEGLVRGLDPWPGVWLRCRGRRVRLLEVRRLDERAPAGKASGEIVEHSRDHLAMVCGDGELLLIERLQPEGRRAMSAGEARNGRQIQPGDRLEAMR